MILGIDKIREDIQEIQGLLDRLFSPSVEDVFNAQVRLRQRWRPMEIAEKKDLDALKAEIEARQAAQEEVLVSLARNLAAVEQLHTYEKLNARIDDLEKLIPLGVQEVLDDLAKRVEAIESGTAPGIMTKIAKLGVKLSGLETELAAQRALMRADNDRQRHLTEGVAAIKKDLCQQGAILESRKGLEDGFARTIAAQLQVQAKGVRGELEELEARFEALLAHEKLAMELLPEVPAQAERWIVTDIVIKGKPR